MPRHIALTPPSPHQQKYLMVPAGTIANTTGLFAGKAGPNRFDPNGIVFYDRDGGQSATANVTVSSRIVAGEATVSLLAWNGSAGR